MLDEFVLFGRRSADPWHRVSCCCQPTFLFIDFCQVVGPKPLFWHPKEYGPHLNLDQVALWVMSSENLHGSVTCMYDQQLGLYALTIYSTVLDLSARAFQRPFALVLLTNSRPSSELIQLFENKCIEFLRPFLACNRQHFQFLMHHLMHIVENVDSDNFNNYYNLLSTTIHLPSKTNLVKGLQIAVNRAKNWYNRTLNGKNFYILNNHVKCDCGLELCEFEKFLPLITSHSASAYLIPIVELAPCMGINFSASFKNLYDELMANKGPKGVLFANKTPILRSFLGANFLFGGDEAQEEEEEGYKNRNDEELLAQRNSTKLSVFQYFSTGLIHSVSHLFSGERIAILASAQKEIQGIEMMKKLNLLRITKRFEEAEWFGNQIERPINGEKQLVGYVCSSSNSADWTDKNYRVVIDLNFMRVKCHEYTGRFLKPLTHVSTRMFPSDESFAAFLIAMLTDIQQCVVLAKYVSPRTVIDRLNLSHADQMIFINSLAELNLLKYSYLKKDVQHLQEYSHMKPIKL